MIKFTLIDLNPAEVSYYLLIITLDQYNGSFNILDYLSTMICVRSEEKI